MVSLHEITSSRGALDHIHFETFIERSRFSTELRPDGTAVRVTSVPHPSGLYAIPRHGNTHPALSMMIASGALDRCQGWNRTRVVAHDRDPGHFRVLPRQRRRPGGRRPDRRRRAGRAVHPDQARSRLSRPRRSPTACSEAGLSPDDLDYVAFYDKPLTKFERLLETYLAYAPRGLPQLPPGHAALAQGQAAHAPDDPPRPGRADPGPAGLHRPPREPRRQRVLPQPVRRGGHPDPRRRRRVEHGDLRRRRGEPDPPDRPHRVPPFARPALLGVHLLLRLQGQQRRIQADGPGPLRPADLPGPDPRAADRPEARRQLLAGHGLLQLLPGADDDQPAVPPTSSAGRRARRSRRSSSGTWTWPPASRP